MSVSPRGLRRKWRDSSSGAFDRDRARESILGYRGVSFFFVAAYYSSWSFDCKTEIGGELLALILRESFMTKKLVFGTALLMLASAELAELGGALG